ncbi:hypothetical protein MCOR02_012353 [Pyricularia oryzae]|nr:hypothetical protein MCOR02_012353 [Pyricularia oryzae]KAI6257255.1 hypothetical protein MCOR19_006319 [Pyricularia oryzae]KAI6407095.1 hypothetical protein MCOR24_007578 [Pyricularia oryzae]KAI6430050.1 hypothetical protein MCOR21_004735 [Pyricularia oryzae]KAI6459362.1 hypothetical protein MCOR15_005946 [Pyricularia oryzae]
MTSVASSPHTTSFLLCASIVNGTPWARKKILDRNGLGSNFFFVANEDSLGDSAWPGRESLVPPSPPHCIFPFTRSSGGASWSSAKHSTEKSWSLQGLLEWGSRLVHPFSTTYDHLDLIGCL